MLLFNDDTHSICPGRLYIYKQVHRDVYIFETIVC